MTFKDTLDYMYNLLPMYQRVGNSAFKKDLTNTYKLCNSLGNPQDKFKSIHIAGTNGKGSSAHMIASILQTSGYKTGLYTSPHLKSFTERIKVNGHEVEEQFVCNFIEKIKSNIEEIQPSFFEITVAMALDYFCQEEVDVAVIEVGLGGRFDSTNVITPIISLITSIGLDHTDMLGDTLPKIAFEKAGIIKPKVPVVISETQEEIVEVFNRKANSVSAPIYYADQEIKASLQRIDTGMLSFCLQTRNGAINGQTDLGGEYQLKNIPGVVKVIELLKNRGFLIDETQIDGGLKNVVGTTGLLGRWQKLDENPLTICDTVHNEAGVKLLISQIEKIDYTSLHVIWGAVEGKSLNHVFEYLPKDAFYYFCEAKIPRALTAEKLMEAAKEFGCAGEIIEDVNDAILIARAKADKDDLIIVGGSNFIIAEIESL